MRSAWSNLDRVPQLTEQFEEGAYLTLAALGAEGAENTLARLPLTPDITEQVEAQMANIPAEIDRVRVRLWAKGGRPGPSIVCRREGASPTAQPAQTAEPPPRRTEAPKPTPASEPDVWQRRAEQAQAQLKQQQATLEEQSRTLQRAKQRCDTLEATNRDLQRRLSVAEQKQEDAWENWKSACEDNRQLQAENQRLQTKLAENEDLGNRATIYIQDLQKANEELKESNDRYFQRDLDALNRACEDAGDDEEEWA